MSSSKKTRSGLQAERVGALGALCRLQSKKKLSVEKRWEPHYLSKQAKEKWIKDYVERETAVATEQVKEAETVIMHEQENLRNVENAWPKTTQPEAVWAILQIPIMRMMRKTLSMKKIPRFACCAKMMNLAGWWAHSPKRYSTTWRVFGRSRWGLTNWCNQDGGTQPTTSVREIWSMGRLNSGFQQLWSPKQTRLHPHHHRRQLESLCRVLISSPDGHKCCKWCLNQEVVKWGWVRRNHRHTVT